MSIKITSSEWRIMAVIWEENPVKLQDILERLSDSEWKPSTVKTFIKRLVDKQYIGYEQQGKKYYYYPLLTEKECIDQEMVAVIKRVYGGIEHAQTNHFAFYGANKPEYIAHLSKGLDDVYRAFESKYNISLRYKQEVFLHKSKQKLHSALGVHSGPHWLRAGWQWRILHMAPEEEFHDIDARKILHHVLFQRLLFDINPQMPVWLSQGLSTYESKWIPKERLVQSLKHELETLQERSLSSTSSHFELFKDQHGYELGYAFVDYVITTYGVDKMNEIMRNPFDMYQLLQISEQEFMKEWIEYIKERYFGNLFNI